MIPLEVTHCQPLEVIFLMTKQGGWPKSGFGPRLRQLREAASLTQAELAERTGCHKQTITKLEAETQEPAWPLVLALTKALGVDCTAFSSIEETAPVKEKKAG